MEGDPTIAFIRRQLQTTSRPGHEDEEVPSPKTQTPDPLRLPYHPAPHALRNQRLEFQHVAVLAPELFGPFGRA